MKLKHPYTQAALIGTAAMISGGIVGYYASKQSGLDQAVESALFYIPIAAGALAGGYWGARILVGLGSIATIVNRNQPSQRAIGASLGVIAGTALGGLEITVGYVFGRGLGNL